MGFCESSGKQRDGFRAVSRFYFATNPYDRDLADLIGELSFPSEELRTRWACHDGEYHRTGCKRIRHPIVGILTELRGLGTRQPGSADQCVHSGSGDTVEGLANRGSRSGAPLL